MRARLLDMGEVGAVRSQSLYHGVTATMRSGDDPAVILLRPASACISFGSFSDPSEAGLAGPGLPVVRRLGQGGSLVVDDNQLYVHLVLPTARGPELGLTGDLMDRLTALSRPLVAACRQLDVDAELYPPGEIRTGGRKVGGLELVEIGDALCLSGYLTLDGDPDSLPERETHLRREMSRPPSLEAVAEALIGACEKLFDLELVPSLPTPEEMEAIEQWDRRLVADAAQTPAAGIPS